MLGMVSTLLRPLGLGVTMIWSLEDHQEEQELGSIAAEALFSLSPLRNATDCFLKSQDQSVPC